jgi:Leucine-rich repeat (LRR) protein
MLSFNLVECISKYCTNKELKKLTSVSKQFHDGSKRSIIYDINPDDISKYFHYKLKLSCHDFIKLNKIYYDRICILDLSNGQLESISGGIGNLVQLQTLYLCKNQLKDIPETIKNLVQLRTLNLCNNKLKSIPYTIGNLVQLQVLNLHRNQLESLPETIGSLVQLQVLNLYRNQLKSIPENIKKSIIFR